MTIVSFSGEVPKSLDLVMGRRLVSPSLVNAIATRWPSMVRRSAAEVHFLCVEGRFGEGPCFVIGQRFTGAVEMQIILHPEAAQEQGLADQPGFDGIDGRLATGGETRD